MKRKYQVGGIVYKLLQSPQLKKSEDTIDLSTITSQVHDPVVMNETKVEGYVPQYTFNTNTNVSSNKTTSDVIEDQTSKQTQNHNIFNPILQATNPTSSTTSVNRPTSNNERIWTDVWNQFGSKLGLKDEKAYLHLLGQIKHESNDFKYMEEIADGSAYEGRKDLGNIRKGDGKKYKGRGPIQVTGRSNYEKIYKEFFVPNGLQQYDVVNNPELANDPKIGSLLSLGWLAVTANGKRAIAESNNYNIRELTKAINGGYNGLDDRIRRTNELIKQYS